MPCPTCDHTMQSVGQLTTGWFLYWCPRCGTLRTTGRVSSRDTGKHEITVTSKRMDDAQPPTLPGRVQKLLATYKHPMDRPQPLYAGLDILNHAWVAGLQEATELNPTRPS